MLFANGNIGILIKKLPTLNPGCAAQLTQMILSSLDTKFGSLSDHFPKVEQEVFKPMSYNGYMSVTTGCPQYFNQDDDLCRYWRYLY